MSISSHGCERLKVASLPPDPVRSTLPASLTTRGLTTARRISLCMGRTPANFAPRRWRSSWATAGAARSHIAGNWNKSWTLEQ